MPKKDFLKNEISNNSRDIFVLLNGMHVGHSTEKLETALPSLSVKTSKFTYIIMYIINFNYILL